VKAKTEVASIVNAINAYDADYSRFPVTRAEQNFAVSVGNLQGFQTDLSLGLTFGPGNGTIYNSGNPGYSYENNNQVMAILMDMEKFPNGVVSSNYNHVCNPKQVKYLSPTMVSDPTQPGVGPDGVYRDPWGNPYIITMDLSFDEQCSDILYARQSVSAPSGGSTGLNGLFNPDLTKQDNYLYHGKVMVWSAGPDKSYDTGPANAGKNKDNILSWQ
jgi:hypothetical protein